MANCDPRIGDLVNEWRRDILELDPIPASEGPNLVETLNVPFTYCWSPALVPKPQDWGSNIGTYLIFFLEEQYILTGQIFVAFSFASRWNIIHLRSFVIS